MPKNAYYEYMMEVKRLEEEIRRKPVSMAVVSKLAAESWNVMSEDEKQIYRDRVKDKSECDSMSDISRASSKSLSSVIQLKKEEKLARKLYMEKRVNSLYQKLLNEKHSLKDNEGASFKNYPLFFMYGNYFYRNIHNEYSPAEIALIKFTFAEGVTNYYHSFVNPGRPTLGYLNDAKEHTENTHGLPVPGLDEGMGEKQMIVIYSKIMRFLKLYGPTTNDEKPMIFTFTSKYSIENDQVDVLNSFFRKFSGGNDFGIDIFPLERLFYILYKALSHRLSDSLFEEDDASLAMSAYPFDGIISSGGSIGCEFHTNNGRLQHCALCHVKVWTCMLGDNFCEALNVPMVGGPHVTYEPENRSDDAMTNSSNSLNTLTGSIMSLTGSVYSESSNSTK